MQQTILYINTPNSYTVGTFMNKIIMKNEKKKKNNQASEG